MTIALDVYVSADCPTCREARKIAGALRVEYPTVQVTVVEHQDNHDWPEEVIGTPTYLLNGRLVALGNPTRERLRALLDEHGGEGDSSSA